MSATLNRSSHSVLPYISVRGTLCSAMMESTLALYARTYQLFRILEAHNMIALLFNVFSCFARSYVSVNQNCPIRKRYSLHIPVNTHVCTVAKAITTLFTSDKSGSTTVFFGLLRYEDCLYFAPWWGQVSYHLYLFVFISITFFTADVSKSSPTHLLSIHTCALLNSYMCMSRDSKPAEYTAPIENFIGRFIHTHDY